MFQPIYKYFNDMPHRVRLANTTRFYNTEWAIIAKNLDGTRGEKRITRH
jgi:hypothetical protein